MNLARIVARVLPTKLKGAFSDRLNATSHRIGLITDRIDEKDVVLDVGCVRHSLENQEWQEPPPGEFLHADLCRTADRVIGLDILGSEVERMDEAGYNVLIGNAETFDLDESFDVIVAGELIEHLSNPGLFLSRCREHLTKCGKIILTTPNPRRFHMLLWYALGREENANREHTLWFDHYVIEELAHREGFDVVDWEYYHPGYTLSTAILFAIGVKSLGGGGYVFELRPTAD
jgi:2-polyprenyl-3-methyl-5-hydroxy-6-metoxy-1,4-benzoquinol methylase